MRDPYLYSDCDVLKNKLDIKEAQVLDNAEVEFSCNALYEISINPLPGKYDFNHFCQFHARIFQDVYEWAGTPRTIPMEKSEEVLGHMSIEYALPENIETEAEKVLQRMNGRNWKNMSIEEQAVNLAKDMADLWKVHCFREGNTRTTVTFVCQFADEHDMPIVRKLFEEHSAYTRNALVAASAIFDDADFRKPEYLINIIEDGLRQGQSKRQQSMDEWENEIAKERANKIFDVKQGKETTKKLEGKRER